LHVVWHACMVVGLNMCRWDVALLVHFVFLKTLVYSHKPITLGPYLELCLKGLKMLLTLKKSL
jgi:hypothetical protein